METQMLDGTLQIGTITASRQFNQLVVPTLDGSGSMRDQAAGGVTKAQATNGAMRGLLTRTKVGRSAANFTFAMVSFDEAPKVRVPPTPITAVDENDDYDPLKGHGGGTRIDLALEQAESLVRDFLAQAQEGGVRHSAVVLLMSDGCCAEPAKTRAVAQRMKDAYGERVKIASTLFATLGQPDAAGEQLLRDIASDPVMYYATVYDAETLRKFLERSVSMASGATLG